MSIGCTCTYLYSGTAIKEEKRFQKQDQHWSDRLVLLERQ